MRFFFLLLCVVGLGLAFDLTLNTGRERGGPYAVLHASNEAPFSCRQIFTDSTMYYECLVPGMVINKLEDQNLTFFDLNFIQDENSTTILILPKLDSKMFELSQKIYEDKLITPGSEGRSRAFSFLFAKDANYRQDVDGLDFDIDFPHESLPSIGALDFNATPVFIPQSADINSYLNIKNEYAKQNFAQVETDTKNAINRYKSSIFMNEFMLYSLRAQNELYTKDPNLRDTQKLDQLIEAAKTWMRTFTSDKNYPEVLHLMLRSYIAMSQKGEADYVMSILNKEQPESYFTELSRLDYADYLYNNANDKENAINLYEDVYLYTKHLDLAARAAVSLARAALLNHDQAKARDYANKFLSSTAKLTGDLDQLLGLARLFYEERDFDLAGALYERAFFALPSIDDRYEAVLKNLALALSQSSRPNEAKRYLDEYANDFVDGRYIDEISRAEDEAFLNSPQQGQDAHAKYQALIAKYETKDANLSHRAVNADVNLYFKEGNFSAVMDYKDQIEEEELTPALALLERAAVNEMNRKMAADECIQTVRLFKDYRRYQVGQKVADKKKLLSCLRRTSNLDEAAAYVDRNFADDPIFYGLARAELDLDDKNYDQALRAAQEISARRAIKSQEEEFKALLLEFLAQLGLDKYNEAMRVMRVLEANYPMNFELIGAYDELVRYANDHNLTTTVLSYAPKAINYQNQKGTNLYSPALEFAYLDALRQRGEYARALEVIRDLAKIKRLSPDERARMLYTQSELYADQNNTPAQLSSLQACLALPAPPPPPPPAPARPGRAGATTAANGPGVNAPGSTAPAAPAATTSGWRELCSQKNELLNSQNENNSTTP